MEEQTAVEIAAMREIAAALETLDLAARRRALNWAMARFVNAPARSELKEDWLTLKSIARDEILRMERASHGPTT